jgi:hypothetical protein
MFFNSPIAREMQGRAGLISGAERRSVGAKMTDSCRMDNPVAAETYVSRRRIP